MSESQPPKQLPSPVEVNSNLELETNELQINTIQSTTADFTVETEGLIAKIRKIGEIQPQLFKCGFCGKTFTRQPSLNYHVNTHTGRKPYVCNEDGCKERFTSPNLKCVHKNKVHKKKSSASTSPTPSTSLDQLDSMASEVANMLSCIDIQLQRNDVNLETKEDAPQTIEADTAADDPVFPYLVYLDNNALELPTPADLSYIDGLVPTVASINFEQSHYNVPTVSSNLVNNLSLQAYITNFNENDNYVLVPPGVAVPPQAHNFDENYNQKSLADLSADVKYVPARTFGTSSAIPQTTIVIDLSDSDDDDTNQSVLDMPNLDASFHETDEPMAAVDINDQSDVPPELTSFETDQNDPTDPAIDIPANINVPVPTDVPKDPTSFQATDKNDPTDSTKNDIGVPVASDPTDLSKDIANVAPATTLATSSAIAEDTEVIDLSDTDDEAPNAKTGRVVKMPKLNDSFYDSDDQMDPVKPVYVIEIDKTMFLSDSEPDEPAVIQEMCQREQEWEAVEQAPNAAATLEVATNLATPASPEVSATNLETPASPEVSATNLETPASPQVVAQADFSRIDVRQLSKCISKVVQQSLAPSCSFEDSPASPIPEATEAPEAPDLSTQPPVSTFPIKGTYDFVTYYNDNNWMYTKSSREMKRYSKLVSAMNPPNPSYYTFKVPTPNSTPPHAANRPLATVIKVPEKPAIRCSDERNLCRHYARGRHARLLNKISKIQKSRKRRRVDVPGETGT